MRVPEGELQRTGDFTGHQASQKPHRGSVAELRPLSQSGVRQRGPVLAAEEWGSSKAIHSVSID